MISGLGSLALTVGLIYLYRKQQELLEQDINREMRVRHTETLKKRIRAWHGDLEEIETSDQAPVAGGSMNLPEVNSASVESAPPAVLVVPREDVFRVVPEAIEGDRYLEDLLENHAPELKELKQNIESQYAAFESARQSFVSEYPEAETIETEDYTLQPMSHHPEWVFERAVRLHRTGVDTSKQREKEIAESRLKGRTSADTERGSVFYSPTPDGGEATYEAVMASGELLDVEEYEDEIVDQLAEIHRGFIENINKKGVYEHGVEAAEILDEMQLSVEELRAKLVEYEGHPLYTGDCPYLDEASV